MKKKMLRIVALIFIVTFVIAFTVALIADCGKEARQLHSSADDSIFDSPGKPKGVILPKEVNTFLESLTKNFEQHDLDAVMEHFSEEFLHQGMTKQEFHVHLTKSYFVKHLNSMTVTLQKFDPEGDVANIAGFIETDLGILLQSSEVLPIAEKSKLRLEKGRWRFYGNQESSPIGRFHDFLAIRASFAPQDLKLYRTLLPEIFDMPEMPTVWIDITEQQRVSLPLTPYRLGRVQLLGTYQGEDGWYVLTLPETSWAPVKFGQIVGYPKYIVDSILFGQTQNSWKGQVYDNGQNILSLEFTPDRTVETWFERLTRPSCLTLIRQMFPAYAYKPTYVIRQIDGGKYPSHKKLVTKATVSSFGTPSISEAFGKVKISVKKDAPWAGLFPRDAVVKGTLIKFSGDFNLKHLILNAELENP